MRRFPAVLVLLPALAVACSTNNNANKSADKGAKPAVTMVQASAVATLIATPSTSTSPTPATPTPSPSPTPSQTSSPAPHATATPSPAPAATRTALSPVPTPSASASSPALASPVLGGSPDAFATLFGPPNNHSGPPGSLQTLHYKRCAGSNVDEFIVLFEKGSAILITHQFCTGAPSAAVREADAQKYFPSGATASGPPLPDPISGGTVRRYVSTSLAGTFPASKFQDCDGNDLPPGTFTLGLGLGPDWDLGVGGCL